MRARTRLVSGFFAMTVREPPLTRAGSRGGAWARTADADGEPYRHVARPYPDAPGIDTQGAVAPMWVKLENPATKRLKLPFMDEPVEFSDNGTAQVTREVGERIIEEVDSAHRFDADDGQGDRTNADDEDTEN